ncbi:flagellar filament capping protein FliD [Pollutimonas harenae]|uniref:Flagellar hook-associated protein 2 n=1 Tax=Pollutimonas harenae TaxID=657015 RepID=A0A853H319_9BURK|nr:flagellar filament capping protein FliD [Pollutimonas harenae]NYT86229.1 flagellar filament capping protein FliD [Pollutimonas harenae]TEA71260.1 flagellar hook-associated protein 2 [Pollutimonas harenae]
MAISSIGVGSGLPLDELLEQLRTAENHSLALIESRATSVQSRLSGYGTIKSSIEALKAASDALGKTDTFGALKTSVGGESYTAAASTKAIAGNYNIEVTTLASAQSLTSAPQAARDTQLATGKVDITVTLNDGTATTLTLDAADTSMEGIVKAINEKSGLGVSATLVNDGKDTPQHYLLLTTKDTGEDAAIASISVSASGDDPTTDVSQLQSLIGFDKGAGTGNFTETAARNAAITINGIAIESQSNTIEDAIEGVTLTLLKETEADKPQTLSVTRDDSVTSKAVNTFVTAYNNLQGIIKTLTSYNVDNQSSSALTGDSLARKVQNQIRDALNVVGAGDTLRSLSQMGISTDPTTGNLKVDNDKLAAALKDNMPDVEKLFAGENGLSASLGRVTDDFIKSGGTISSATDSMTSTLKNLEEQYEAMSDRIDAKMETYRKQFSQLDSMMAQMNSISSYLTQQLSMLGNMSKEK